MKVIFDEGKSTIKVEKQLRKKCFAQRVVCVVLEHLLENDHLLIL